MIRKIRPRLTYANVMATLAVFLGLGGTALAGGVIITSNSQVAQNTISGHHPTPGKHPNIIFGSITGSDVQSGSIGASQLNNDQKFRALSLKNGWSKFGFGTFGPSLYKDPLGVVHLRGSMSGTSDNVAFTLPAAFRPTNTLQMPAMGGGPEAAFLQVASNGDVTPLCTSGSCIIGMDGLSYRP